MLVGAFNQEKALVGAFSVIVKLHSSRRSVCSSTTEPCLELQLARHNSEQEFTLKIVSVMEPLIEYLTHCWNLNLKGSKWKHLRVFHSPLCEKCLQNASNQLPFYSDGGKRRGDGLCLKLSPRVSQHLWEISWKTSVERNINFLEVADEIQSHLIKIQNLHCTMQWCLCQSEWYYSAWFSRIYCHSFSWKLYIYFKWNNNVINTSVNVMEAAMRSRFVPPRRRYNLGDDSPCRWK